MKRLPQTQIILAIVYIILNIKQIRAAFKSEIWSKEIDLVNHVTNYTIHLQVISVVLLLSIIFFILAIAKNIKSPAWILILIVGLTSLLLINTLIDFSRWIEINVFAGIALLLFVVIYSIIVLVRLAQKKSTIT